MSRKSQRSRCSSTRPQSILFASNLFDEFDAIGSDRARPNEVGEIRRVLNSFLQFVEADDSDSLILAATNQVEVLDPALFRRFDVVIHYGLPTAVRPRD